MHRNFADWYRLVEIEPTDQLLKRRWPAVEKFAKAATAPQILDLVRLLYGRPPKKEDLDQEFRDAFRVFDSAFPSQDNDAEIRVLAGACLVAILEGRRASVPLLAALAIVCGEWLASDETKAGLLDFPDRARRLLTTQALEVRKTDDPPEIATLGEELAKQAEAVNSALRQGNWSPVATASAAAIQTLAAAIGQLSSAVAEAVSSAEHVQSVCSEEINILWWLFAEHSRDLEVPFRDLGVPATCVVAGKELNDLVVFAPGPVSARAILARMLRSLDPDLRSTASFADVVNATPREWRIRLAEELRDVPANDLTPVLLAVTKSLETDGKEDWLPVYEKATGAPARQVVSLLDVGYQVYQEMMLLANIPRKR